MLLKEIRLIGCRFDLGVDFYTMLFSLRCEELWWPSLIEEDGLSLVYRQLSLMEFFLFSCMDCVMTKFILALLLPVDFLPLFEAT